MLGKKKVREPHHNTGYRLATGRTGWQTGWQPSRDGHPKQQSESSVSSFYVPLALHPWNCVSPSIPLNPRFDFGTISFYWIARLHGSGQCFCWSSQWCPEEKCPLLVCSRLCIVRGPGSLRNWKPPNPSAIADGIYMLRRPSAAQAIRQRGSGHIA